MAIGGRVRSRIPPGGTPVAHRNAESVHRRKELAMKVKVAALLALAAAGIIALVLVRGGAEPAGPAPAAPATTATDPTRAVDAKHLEKLPDDGLGVQQRQLVSIRREDSHPTQVETESTASGDKDISLVIAPADGAGKGDGAACHCLVLVNGPRFPQSLAADLLDPLLVDGVQVIHLDRQRPPQKVQQGASHLSALIRCGSGQRRMECLPLARRCGPTPLP